MQLSKIIFMLSVCFCRRELAKEVVEHLTSAADGAKSLIDASDKLILYVEIARLYGTLGYQRKAAFFSRQVAQLYLQQENRLAAISAMQVLALTTKAYRVQSRASAPEKFVTKVSNWYHYSFLPLVILGFNLVFAFNRIINLHFGTDIRKIANY